MSYSISNPLLVATFTVGKQNYRIVRTGPDYSYHLHLERQSKDLLGQEVWLVTLLDKNNWTDLFFSIESHDRRKNRVLAAKYGADEWYPVEYLSIKGYISRQIERNSHRPDDVYHGIHKYTTANSSANPLILEKVLREIDILTDEAKQIVLAGIASYLLT